MKCPLYDGFGTADQKPQSQEEVYKRFFEDLETAVNILKDYKGGVSFESAASNKGGYPWNGQLR